MKKYSSLVFAYIFISILFATIAYGAEGEKDILTPQERSWLNKNKSRLTLAVETNYAPFVFIGSNDAPTGLAHDYMLLVESKLGVRFGQKRFSSLSDIFDKVRSKEVHIVNAVTKTPERSSFLLFSEPFISVPNVIVVNKNRQETMGEKELSGLRISLVKSYAVTEYLIGKNLGITPELASDDLTALLNVSFGHSEAAVVDLATASYLITQKGITNLKVAGEVEYGIKLSMATPADEPIFHTIIQKALGAITQAQKEEINRRWINASGRSIFSDWRFWAVLASVLFGSIVIIIWNRTLQRQIDLRTEAEQKLQVLNSDLTKQVEEGVAKRMKVELEHQKEHEALIQSEKMAQLGSMLGAIIHQWRQPLNTIALDVQDIRYAYENKELNTESIDAFISSVMEKIQFMSKTADDFKDFYKPSKERMVFSIIEQVESVIKLLDKQLILSDIELQIDGDRALTSVGFASEFKQVVLNIINNARDVFCERKTPHPLLRICVVQDGAKAILTISDNAGGIPDELLPDKLFEEFSSSKGEEGTGIGLYLSRSIVEKNMSGSLKAENTNDGARFSIELPLVI